MLSWILYRETFLDDYNLPLLDVLLQSAEYTT